jgi:uncharacterized protein
MNFEWDQQKNIANFANHGFSFEDASRIFRFPVRVSLDERQDYGEERLVGIGMLDGRIVVIVFTEPDEKTVRVISLRKANSYERKLYERYIQDRLG